MALRKVHNEILQEKELLNGEVVKAIITALPFAFGLDNGIVRIVQGEDIDIYLSYDMIARLYEIVFPSRTFTCGPDGCAIELPNHATFSEQEKIVMWARFPDTVPNDASEESLAVLRLFQVYSRLGSK